MNIRKPLLLMNLTLVLVLCGIIAKTILWRDVPKNASAGTTVTAEDSGPQSEKSLPKSNRADYKAIVDNDLFGGTDTTSASSEQLNSPKPAEVWKIDLVLQGTIAGPDDIARAIIKDPSAKTTDLYKTGDMIAGARLSRITKDSVILIRDGREKVLRIDSLKSSSEQSSGQSAKRRGSSPHAVMRIEKSKGQPRTRNEMIEDFLSNARIEPYIVDGQCCGLRISELDNVKAKDLLGLKDADVIEVVNGQRLTSKQKAFQVFKKVRTQPWLNIEYLREGKSETLSFGLK